MQFDARIVAVRDQVSADLSGEFVILHLTTGVYHGLDQVGSRVWELIQQPRTFREIYNVLLAEYEVDDATCERDLRELLEQLEKANLIEFLDT